MARRSVILVPSGEAVIKVGSLAAASSSTEQALGQYQVFAVIGIRPTTSTSIATTGFHIKFGRTGMPAAAATDMFLPPGQLVTLDTGSAFTHVRFFNPHATEAIDIYVLPLITN